MGFSHVLIVRHDAIRDFHPTKDDSGEFCRELGEAVLKLCLKPDLVSTERGQVPLRSHNLNQYGDAVTHSATIHSTDETVLAWCGNCLQTLGELDDEAVEQVKALFDALYEHRQMQGSSKDLESPEGQSL